MVTLLALSTALAILIPETPRNGPERQSPPAATDPQPARDPAAGEEAGRRPGTGGGETVEPPGGSDPGRTIERTVRAGKPIERIPARPGDRLVLEVRSPIPVEIEIEGAGLIDMADPYDPARFDVQVRSEPRRLVVREVGIAGRKVAVVEVR